MSQLVLTDKAKDWIKIRRIEYRSLAKKVLSEKKPYELYKWESDQWDEFQKLFVNKRKHMSRHKKEWEKQFRKQFRNVLYKLRWQSKFEQKLELNNEMNSSPVEDKSESGDGRNENELGGSVTRVSRPRGRAPHCATTSSTTRSASQPDEKMKEVLDFHTKMEGFLQSFVDDGKRSLGQASFHFSYAIQEDDGRMLSNSINITSSDLEKPSKDIVDRLTKTWEEYCDIFDDELADDSDEGSAMSVWSLGN